jgi:hypothetical protein
MTGIVFDTGQERKQSRAGVGSGVLVARSRLARKGGVRPALLRPRSGRRPGAVHTCQQRPAFPCEQRSARHYWVSAQRTRGAPRPPVSSATWKPVLCSCNEPSGDQIQAFEEGFNTRGPSPTVSSPGRKLRPHRQSCGPSSKRSLGRRAATVGRGAVPRRRYRSTKKLRRTPHPSHPGSVGRESSQQVGKLKRPVDQLAWIIC